MKILIMGLPGAGKTTLAQELKNKLIDSNFTVNWFNADEIRKQYNDWDFSTDGRIRQSIRMNDLSEKSTTDFTICDFIAPTQIIRDKFNADCIIWVDTIDESRFADTNQIFEKPKYNIRVDSKHAVYWANQIKRYLQTVDNVNNSLNLSLNNLITQTKT